MRQDKKTFHIYLQAIAVSRLGSQLSFTALTLWAAYHFGSGIHAGLLASVPMVAGLLTGLLAGPFIDRYSPKLLMISADIINAAAAFLVASCLWFSPENSPWFFGALLGMRTLSTMASSVFEPSSQVLLPLIVTSDKLMRANSRVAATKSATGLIGDSISGLLFKVIGATGLFVIDGLSYLISAMLLPFMREQKTETQPKERRKKNIWQEMKEGFFYILGQKGLQQVLMAALAVNFLLQPIGLLLAFYCKNRLGLAPSWYGIFLGVFTMSNLVAAAFSAEWLARFKHKRNMIFALHIFAIGLSQMILFLGASPWFAIASLMLLGLAQGPLNVMIFTAIQTQTPREIQGRVHGTLMALFGAASPIGVTFAGYFIDQLQSQMHYWFLGGFIMCLIAASCCLGAKPLEAYLFGERDAL